MRFFDLLNFQHVMGYLFVALSFMLVFGLGLGYVHFRGARSERRRNEVVYRFPEEIDDRNAPFPLIMTLVIIGTIVWGFFYIYMHGRLGVKI